MHEALDQSQDGGLTGAGVPDEGGETASGGGEGQVFQDGFAVVGEGHVGELDAGGALNGDRAGGGRAGGLLRQGEQVVEA